MTYLDVLAERIRQLSVVYTEVPENSELLFRLYAFLALSKGINTTSSDVHNAWVLWMQGINEKHEFMVPFEDLPFETRKLDEPFRDAIVAASFELTVL